MVDARHVITYSINESDALVRVSEGWRTFAIENDSVELCDGCTGTSLWTHIHGADVQQIYRELLNRVRVTRRTVTFPFRCDSPLMLREMQMEMSAASAGGVDFRVSLLIEKQHQQRMALLDRRVAQAADEFLGICAWCKSVRVEGNWMPLEVGIERLGLLSVPKMPQLTHGICDRCLLLVASTGD